MTDLIPVSELSAVPQLEVNTLAIGGPGNPMNQQAQALLNRTAFLDAERLAQDLSISALQDRDARQKYTFDYLTEAEIADVESGTATIDVTAKIQQAMDENKVLIVNPGIYRITQLKHPATLLQLAGMTSKAGVTFRHDPLATGDIYVWDNVRVRDAFISNIYLEGNNTAGEGSGWNHTGFSYCTFVNLRARLFKEDGLFSNGEITPVNKQNSNNTYINCTFNNNSRHGLWFTGTDPQRFENTANVFLGCEFAGNAMIGVNAEVAEACHFLGCTSQGNSVGDVLMNSRHTVFTGYAEGVPKTVELGALSYGCEVRIRTGYPLWNTFKGAGINNNHQLSVMGERRAEWNIFHNPYFLNWSGTVPDGLTANGAIAAASFSDTRSIFASDLQITTGGNTQGVIFSLTANSADVAGQWVTLCVEVDTSGVVDPLETRVYARDGTTLNTTTGQFAVEALPHTAAGTYQRLFYDVKFPAVIGGVATLIWYISYANNSAGGNVTKIRSAHLLVGQTRELSMFGGDQGRQILATTAQLASVTSGINIHRKFEGKPVFNSTTNRPVWAADGTAGGLWLFSDATTAHTPV